MENFLAQAKDLPKPYSTAEARRHREQWLMLADRQEAPLAAWMRQESLSPLLDAVAGNSPYLARLLLLHPGIPYSIAMQGIDAAYAELMAALPVHAEGRLMQHLRIAKGRLALLVALADIAGLWPLDKVTAALSDFAENALSLAADMLLKNAHRRGEIVLPEESGVIVLGMGKLGGRELNYSSDIDLILFYEPGRLNYRGRLSEQHFMNRLVHDLVAIMQERDRDGYVFRTDVRLRPDPASMPPAISTGTAYAYYESVGQNWERAAMIKARPVAGDLKAGEKFLKGITPFMWRRSLDFAAIDDIHSIKRQMDSRQSRDIGLKGHNIKLGQGGIREIEFYTQIHQLIWGGREPTLRVRSTCEALKRLAEAKLVEADKAEPLIESYAYLRKLEHRLQMIADEQTHTIPASDDGLAHIACFMGFDSVAAFEKETMRVLTGVHEIYASSFKSAEKLGGDEGRLVFTGVSHDSGTLETLRRMGYSEPERISEIVMGWHHGAARATRTKRARELLTELMPALLKAFAATGNPDAAFIKFDEFLRRLPAGVQLFSLFSVNPHLLSLIADIMGSAPTLADQLSKSPDLLDAVLAPDFYADLPDETAIGRQLEEALAQAEDFEIRMETLRRFRNEKRFQAGVQLLKGMIEARQAGAFLSMLADAAIGRALDSVCEEFRHAYGSVAASHIGIIALGKLGSREMTFSSDIDLVFVYEAAPDARSDGGKSLSAGEYFHRLAQRFVHALTTIGKHGRLYEVDMRLRPSGEQGPLAVNFPALKHYFDTQAWTFEFMAFTKARVLIAFPLEGGRSGWGSNTDNDPHLYPPPSRGRIIFSECLNHFIQAQLTRSRDPEKLCADADDMRSRIDREYGTRDPWDIKYVRGGLMDIDFIAETLLLKHAPDTPDAHTGGARDIFLWLKEKGELQPDIADGLLDAEQFLGKIFHMLRLCSSQAFNENNAPPGLKKLLAESLKEKDFETLKKRLIHVEETVRGYYNALLK